MIIEYLGNKELLNVPKTGFLASSTIPPDMVLKCYDWATQMAKEGRCVIRKKNIWEVLIRVVVAALTAALTAVTTTSCMGAGPF